METNSSIFEKFAKDAFLVSASVFSFVFVFLSAQPGNFFAGVPFVSLCSVFVVLVLTIPQTPLFNASKTITAFGFVILSMDYIFSDSIITIQQQYYFFWFVVASLTPAFFQLKSSPMQYFIAISLFLQVTFITELTSGAFWIPGFFLVIPLALIYSLHRKFSFSSEMLFALLTVSVLVCSAKDFFTLNTHSFVLSGLMLLGYGSTFLLGRTKLFDF